MTSLPNHHFLVQSGEAWMRVGPNPYVPMITTSPKSSYSPNILKMRWLQVCLENLSDIFARMDEKTKTKERRQGGQSDSKIQRLLKKVVCNTTRTPFIQCFFLWISFVFVSTYLIIWKITVLGPWGMYCLWCVNPQPYSLLLAFCGSIGFWQVVLMNAMWKRAHLTACPSEKNTGFCCFTNP